MSVDVQACHVSDWKRLREIRLRALADAPDAFGSTWASEIHQPEQEWRRRLLKPHRATFIASLNTDDVGLAIIARIDEKTAGLYSVWVATEARGLGTGDGLIRKCVAWARKSNFGRIVLDVGDGNTHAIRLYQRHGFERTGTKGALPAPRTHVTEHERAKSLRKNRLPND